MTLNATAAGILTGKFKIPANVPAGSKRVAFTGAGGSYGEATFIGDGTMVSETKRVVIRTTETRWNTDPLAQTFSLPQSCQVGAVDLWFTVKGAKPIVVQMRETTVGMPNQTVLAEARLPAANILLGGAHTRIAFPAPVALNGGQEYALVVLSDDPDTSLAIAELGKWDANASRWVTSQPYQVGVLLSSSNASTWTPHQDKDLAFRILQASFTENAKGIPLGNIAVNGVTDLMLLAFAERPSASAAVDYELTLPTGDKVRVASGQPVRLPTSVTGNVGVAARLSGSNQSAPVLHPGSQLVSGKVAATGDYVTDAIPAGNNSRVRVIFEAIIPGGSSVAVSASGIEAGSAYQAVPYLSSKPVGDGFQEMIHELPSISEAMVRVKLVLSGTTAARPRLRKLRIVVL